MMFILKVSGSGRVGERFEMALPVGKCVEGRKCFEAVSDYRLPVYMSGSPA
jgi:hypothetical protein